MKRGEPPSRPGASPHPHRLLVHLLIVPDGPVGERADACADGGLLPVRSAQPPRPDGPDTSTDVSAVGPGCASTIRGGPWPASRPPPTPPHPSRSRTARRRRAETRTRSARPPTTRPPGPAPTAPASAAPGGGTGPSGSWPTAPSATPSSRWPASSADRSATRAAPRSARLVDVVCRWSGDETYPPVTGLVVRVGRRLAFVDAVRHRHDRAPRRACCSSARLDLRGLHAPDRRGHAVRPGARPPARRRRRRPGHPGRRPLPGPGLRPVPPGRVWTSRPRACCAGWARPAGATARPPTG